MKIKTHVKNDLSEDKTQAEKYIYMYTYTDHVGTKTISIMDDVYDKLKSLKSRNESFSDELRRLTETKGNIMDLAGAWSDITEEEGEKMKKAITSMRGGTRTNELIKKLK
ncbi:antitoxin VapB family protein [archaeon]|nr:antitoxin VapB family protein [archaeon]